MSGAKRLSSVEYWELSEFLGSVGTVRRLIRVDRTLIFSTQFQETNWRIGPLNILIRTIEWTIQVGGIVEK